MKLAISIKTMKQIKRKLFNPKKKQKSHIMENFKSKIQEIQQAWHSKVEEVNRYS